MPTDVIEIVELKRKLFDDPKSTQPYISEANTVIFKSFLSEIAKNL